MIDTIKLGIPLTSYQFKKVRKKLEQDDRYQWVQYQVTTGEIRFLRRRGLLQLDNPSFHRDVLWNISDTYKGNETYLEIELSLPKFWYGHNISLLYNFYTALVELKKIFEKQLNLKLEIVANWQIFRLDCCYTWFCETQENAKQIIESLQCFHYPRKKPHIYPGESILFAGKTYSLKFYLKLPEFRKHDKPALKKAKAKEDWIKHLEDKATGVLRCEATLRRQYLKTINLLTVADLLQPNEEITANEDLLENHPELETDDQTFINCIETIFLYHCEEEFVEPSERVISKASKILKAPEMLSYFSGEEFKFKGGSITIRTNDTPTTLLQFFLKKFLGDYRGMDTAQEVESKLLEKYKPTKATRLLGFWLYVQKFGSGKAKEIYTHTAYYDAKRALKEAEVTLIEQPKVINASDRFRDKFKLEVPSEFATNRVDDFRDSESLLNLRPDKLDSACQ